MKGSRLMESSLWTYLSSFLETGATYAEKVALVPENANMIFMVCIGKT